jgi:hypothetical protein
VKSFKRVRGVRLRERNSNERGELRGGISRLRVRAESELN